MPVYKCRREGSFPRGLCFQRAISFSTENLRTQGPKFAVSKNAVVVSGERFRFRVVCVFNGTPVCASTEFGRLGLRLVADSLE